MSVRSSFSFRSGKRAIATLNSKTKFSRIINGCVYVLADWGTIMFRMSGLCSQLVRAITSIPIIMLTQRSHPETIMSIRHLHSRLSVAHCSHQKCLHFVSLQSHQTWDGATFQETELIWQLPQSEVWALMVLLRTTWRSKPPAS